MAGRRYPALAVGGGGGAMPTRLLIVDDEQAILDALSYTLQREGFEVVEALDGDQALAAARMQPFDLVLLDVMLPGQSGMDVCRTLRAESDVPIVMVTARDAEVDRVLGLELGADDYVTKPFSMAELVSRIRAILRRRELDQSAIPVRAIGGVRIDYSAHDVTVDGEPVRLTPSEFKVLALLAEQPERVFTRRQIMEHLWDSVYVGDERAADVHVSSLRRKIERDPAQPQRLITVRGVGYKLART
jgi:two-component system response regulator RegX3